MEPRTFKQKFISTLSSLYDKREAEEVFFRSLEFVLNTENRSEAIMKYLSPISSSESEKMLSILYELEKGRPIQYILGYEEFCGNRISVGEGVLIPRPETQQIVSIVEDYLKNTALSHYVIADFCCGSGCIGISLAANIGSMVSVIGLDIEDKAIYYSEKNATDLNLSNYSVKKINVLSETVELNDIDVIVCNPPYVMNKEKKDMEERVLSHEPGIALFVDDDEPLIFYTAVSRHASNILRSGGILVFEVNTALAQETELEVQKFGFVKTQIIDDYIGRPRFVTAIKK